ncbi:MAG: hypothetical protein Q7K21_04810, partial [Elusimicrobiota bacterium]|nr:hypothetical protein [Elusimicrobiota bacterium]
MVESQNKDILKFYDDNLDSLKSFRDKLCSLLKEILLNNTVQVHSITCRVKERNSIVKKILKKEEYIYFEDITDVIGLRIITFFADDIDAIAKIIESEFKIDKENSIDKRMILDPDRFGYLSLHYIVQLSDNRSKLIEYNKFSNFKFEIQIRSILQHAWAEIEHDLGYKTKLSIPRHITRRFSRLAGLLELGDQEFTTIRNELKKYEKDITKNIIDSPQSVNIDKVSLSIFINTNTVLLKLDSEIMKLAGAKTRETISSEMIQKDIETMNYFNIKTIDELETHMKTESKLIISFATIWLKNSKYPSFFAGISIFYLFYILVGQIG